MAFKAGQGAIWNNVIIHAAAKNKEIIALLRSLVQKIYLYFTINSLVRFAHSIRLFGEIFIYFFHLFPTAGNNFFIFCRRMNNTPFFTLWKDPNKAESSLNHTSITHALGHTFLQSTILTSVSMNFCDRAILLTAFFPAAPLTPSKKLIHKDNRLLTSSSWMNQIL